MITPDEIREKAERLFPKAISAWLAAEDDFFPRRLAVDLSVKGKSHPQLIQAVSQLRERSKEVTGSGYSVLYERIHSRQFGDNLFPVAIHIDSLADLLKLTRRQTEFQRLERAVRCVRQQLPQLESWLQEHSNWKQLLLVADDLDDLLAVVVYICQHPRPNCYLRELPLPISTKLIERNKALLRAWLDRVLSAEHIDFGCDNRHFEQRYGFRYGRQHLLVRLLDSKLQSLLGLPCSELSLPAEELARLPVGDAPVIIVENRINLLTLPAMAGSLALGGLGNNLAEFQRLPWLNSRTIRYWGDLDVEGLQILARLRHLYPQTMSFLMDMATLEAHRQLWTEGKNSQPTSEPAHLQAAELEAFQFCLAHNVRLEQEHIPQSSVLAACSDWPQV